MWEEDWGGVVGWVGAFTANVLSPETVLIAGPEGLHRTADCIHVMRLDLTHKHAASFAVWTRDI